MSAMKTKKPFNKDTKTKISFGELIELIGATCDYKFCIVDETIDDELMELAARHGIDLTGYKHVIETSGIQHSEKRHGQESKDRTPLTLKDYLLVPFIIKTGTIFASQLQKPDSENQLYLFTKNR